MFLFAGAMAEGMRTQLTVPNNNFVTENVYNQLFTMHGTIMLFVFLGPFAFAGLGNYLVPLHDRRARHGLPPVQQPFRTGCSSAGCITMSAGFLTITGPPTSVGSPTPR